MTQSNHLNLRTLLIAAVVVFSAGASAEPAAAASRYFKVVGPVGKVVWIRSGPAWTFKRIGFLPARARHIGSTGCKALATGRWCRVQYRGTWGWVPRRNLARDTMRAA